MTESHFGRIDFSAELQVPQETQVDPNNWDLLASAPLPSHDEQVPTGQPMGFAEESYAPSQFPPNSIHLGTNGQGRNRWQTEGIGKRGNPYSYIAVEKFTSDPS